MIAKYKKSALIALFSYITIISTGYPLSTVSGNKNYYIVLCFTIILFFYYISFKKIKRSHKIKIETLCYLCFVNLIITSFIVNFNFENAPSNIRLIGVISFGFIVTKLITFENYVFYFIKLMKIITVISLIVFISANYFNVLLPLPIIENVNKATYYNGYIVFLFKKYGINRNLGIFWEPGVFSTYLIFSILLESLKNKPSKINIILFLIGIWSTKSTYGYFIVIIITIYFISKYSRKSLNIIFLLSLLILGTFLKKFKSNILIFLNEINPLVFSKIVNKTDSISDRVISPITNLEIFSKNPFFGVGVGEFDSVYKKLTFVKQTSTSTYFLGVLGIFGILYTVYIIIGILKFKKINLSSRILFLLIFLMAVNKEPHINFSATYTLMFYFLKRKDLIL